MSGRSSLALRIGIGRRLRTVVLLPLLIGVYALLAAALAAALQARVISDASADAILVIAEKPLRPGLADHVAQLLEDDRAVAAYIGGSAAVDLTNALRARRLSDRQVIAPPLSSSAGLTAAAQRAGIRTVLVVTEPTQQLAQLKQIRDSGLTAFSVPASVTSLSPGELLTAALSYWSGLLISRSSS